MKLIEWINGKTKLNKTTFDGFQNNINKGKVDKSGDIMTGVLQIQNKYNFEGIKKIRTIDGTDYTAILGVGFSGSASLELSDTNGGILGRIDVHKDGTIKNFKTGNYLAEKDSKFQNLSLVNGITGGSIIKGVRYKKTGGIVSVIGDISGVKGEQTIIATLPVGYRPAYQTYVLGTCSGQRFCRWVILPAGNIILEWVSDGKYDLPWYELNFSFPIN